MAANVQKLGRAIGKIGGAIRALNAARDRAEDKDADSDKLEAYEDAINHAADAETSLKRAADELVKGNEAKAQSLVNRAKVSLKTSSRAGGLARAASAISGVRDAANMI